MADSDYWMLEGFDRATDVLLEKHLLAGKSDRYWGDLFGRAADDPLLGEWEVTETERQGTLGSLSTSTPVPTSSAVGEIPDEAPPIRGGPPIGHQPLTAGRQTHAKTSLTESQTKLAVDQLVDPMPATLDLVIAQ